MLKLNPARILLILLALVTLVLLGVPASIAYQRTKTHRIVIAAGSSKAESYVLMQALKTVVERNYPRLKVLVYETGGTTDSLVRLERGEAQLAAAQADATAGASASIVAVLFEDSFQLLVHNGSSIQKFTDLKGKRIALPRTGGQYKSFLFLAGHFGLRESDFVFVGSDDESAGLAFASEQADALFLVRGLHNSSITRLAIAGKVTFLPIDQASAMHIMQAAYTPAIIPQGAYLGDPPIPAADLHTLALERILLARRDVADDVIYAITEVLMERRQELAAAIPDTEDAVRTLLSSMKQPASGIGSEAGIHPGAMTYYDRERRSFVQSHTDLLAFILIVCGLILVWVSALKRSFEWDQKSHAREYNRTILQLMQEALSSTSDRQLGPIRAELLTILTAAIRDLDRNRISDETFQSLRVVWQIAFDASRNRKTPFEGSVAPLSEDAVEVTARSLELKKPWWSFLSFGQSKSNAG